MKVPQAGSPRARFVLLGGLLGLLATHALRAGEAPPRQEWTRPVAHDPVPIALVPPVVDGLDDDLAWRAPATRTGYLAPPRVPSPDLAARPFGPVRLTCDATHVYGLISTRGRKNRRSELEIRFGPAPWQTRRLRLAEDGTLQSEEWNGWDWTSTWASRAAVKRTVDGEKTVTEFAIPRSEITPAPPSAAAGMTLSVMETSGGDRARFHTDPGQGCILGVEATVQRVTVRKNPRGGWSVRIDGVTWAGGEAAGELTMRPLGCDQAHEARKVPWRSPSGSAVSITMPLPPGARELELSLALEGQPTQHWHVRPPPAPAVDDSTRLRNALVASRLAARMAAAPTEGEWQETLGPVPVRPQRLPQEDLGLDANVFDDKGAPLWGRLAEQAQRWAFWRAVYLDHLRHGGMLPFLKEPLTHDEEEATRRAKAWLLHLRTLPEPTPGAPHPAWHPDIAAPRARVLTRLARGPLSKPAHRTFQLDCVAEVLRTQQAVMATLLIDNGVSALDPDLCRLLAANALTLPGFFDIPSELRLLHALSRKQFAAHLNPDGSSRRGGDAAAHAFQAFLRLGKLRGETEVDEKTCAFVKKMLHYHAGRVLPTARLPRFSDTTEDFLEPPYAQWAERFFPEDALLARFRPEGLVASPLSDSRPKPDRGGGGDTLYLMRSAGGHLAVAVNARGRDASTLPAPVTAYSALALSTAQHDLILEPPPGSPAPVAVDGAGPLAASLPAPGEAPPGRWLTHAEADWLELTWQTAPEQAGASSVRRGLLLAKGAAAQSYLYVCDAIRFEPAPPTRQLGQLFHLAAEADGRLRFELPDGEAKYQRLPPIPGHAGSGLLVTHALQAVHAGELLILPVPPQNSRESTRPPLATVKRLGPPLPTGGGVLQVDLAEGRQDLILSDPHRHGLKLDFEGGHARMEGRLALLRYPPAGLQTLFCREVKQVSVQHRIGVTVGFSQTTDAVLRMRPDGAWSARLLGAQKEPVTLEVKLDAPDGTSRTARILLNPGTTTVFRLL